MMCIGDPWVGEVHRYEVEDPRREDAWVDKRETEPHRAAAFMEMSGVFAMGADAHLLGSTASYTAQWVVL